MSFLDRIRECNEHDLSRFRPLFVAGTRIGWVRDDMVRLLTDFPDVFSVAADRVTLVPSLADFEERSVAVERVLRSLEAEGAMPGWRDEAYPVKVSFADPPLLRAERAAIPRLGIRAYGVHMSGYVRDGRGLKMWIARRARNKPTFPGMLDNMVAGGQPIGLSLTDNLVKESGEEAGIPPALARRALPIGLVSYVKEVPEGLKPDVLFCYDLELPKDFTPVAVDGEIESFELWPVERVMEVVSRTAEFKFNCNLVIIDFLVRHGCIRPEDADYLDIVQGLRR